MPAAPTISTKSSPVRLRAVPLLVLVLPFVCFFAESRRLLRGKNARKKAAKKRALALAKEGIRRGYDELPRTAPVVREEGHETASDADVALPVTLENTRIAQVFAETTDASIFAEYPPRKDSPGEFQLATVLKKAHDQVFCCEQTRKLEAWSFREIGVTVQIELKFDNVASDEGSGRDVPEPLFFQFSTLLKGDGDHPRSFKLRAGDHPRAGMYFRTLLEDKAITGTDADASGGFLAACGSTTWGQIVVAMEELSEREKEKLRPGMMRTATEREAEKVKRTMKGKNETHVRRDWNGANRVLDWSRATATVQEVIANYGESSQSWYKKVSSRRF